jgi:hypothetical protein
LLGLAELELQAAELLEPMVLIVLSLQQPYQVLQHIYPKVVARAANQVHI